MQDIHGLLGVHKPTGMVSKDVSRWLTKRLGKLKLGHVGTLDPMASGVLPILLGKATKLQDYLLDLDKAYEFDMEFGKETDTLDLEGSVVKTAPWEHISREAVERSAAELTGAIQQIPPLYSAIKFKGRALYDYVRSGKGDRVPVEALKRDVKVYKFQLLKFDGNRATFAVDCSKGTYIRVLAKDLAEKLGSCATLTRLVRTQAAGIGLAETFSLEELETKIGNVASLVLPVDRLNLGLPVWLGESEAVAKLKTGQKVILESGELLSKGMPEKVICGQISLALRDCENRLFGLGVVRSVDAARVELAMKRGI